jgi:hypothetical protein
VPGASNATGAKGATGAAGVEGEEGEAGGKVSGKLVFNVVDNNFATTTLRGDGRGDGTGDIVGGVWGEMSIDLTTIEERPLHAEWVTLTAPSNSNTGHPAGRVSDLTGEILSPYTNSNIMWDIKYIFSILIGIWY